MLSSSAVEGSSRTRENGSCWIENASRAAPSQAVPRLNVIHQWQHSTQPAARLSSVVLSRRIATEVSTGHSVPETAVSPNRWGSSTRSEMGKAQYHRRVLLIEPSRWG